MALTVVNLGSISATGSAVELGGGGSVTNQSGATISSEFGDGVLGGAAMTVVNAGSISGISADAVKFAAGYTNLLVIDPGAAFAGTVDGGNPIAATTTSTLELASATSAGTLTGLGTQFIDFARVALDAGATWVLAGANTIGAGVTLTNPSGTLQLATDGTLINAGSIAASHAFDFKGVDLLADSTVTNQSTGVISGFYGIHGSGGAVAVVNAGTINGSRAGIRLDSGGSGSITNQRSATISGGGGGGIYGFGGALTVVNAGDIAGGGNGIEFLDSGSVTNQSNGTISGGTRVYASGAAPMTIVNAGRITGATSEFGEGIRLHGSAIVTNQSGGEISGNVAIYARIGAATVVNAGTISGVVDAVSFNPGYANRLVVDPGAAFSGTANGGGAPSTLEFSGDGGTIDNSGTQFVNFGTLQIDAGADWTLPGTTSVGTFSAQGELTIASAATLSTSAGATVSGAGAPAQVVVTGGGLLGGGAQLVLGSTGAGTLLLTEGGQATAATTQTAVPAVVLGASAGAEGFLWVSGAGSMFTASGQIEVGEAGDGHLQVENAGTVQSGGSTIDPTQGFDIGTDAGAAGDATVTGSQSLLDNAGQFIVGDGDLGSMSIEHGGTVITTPGTVVGLAGAVVVNTANAAGSSVNVTGAGSNWQVGGLLQIGNAGAGALNITAGGTVTAGSLDAGVASSGGSQGIGEISLSGTASALGLTGAATIGDAGSAVLSILNGATLDAAGMTIGAQIGGSGAVLVSGSDSVLDLTGTLYVGTTLGVGELTIGPNATVIAHRVIQHGEVVDQGGTLDPPGGGEIDITKGSSFVGFGALGGTGDLIVNTGTIEAQAGSQASQARLTITGTLVGNGTSLAPPGTGHLQIDSDSTLVMNGPMDSSQSLNFADGTGVLVLDDIIGFQGTIAGVTVGDEIFVNGASIATDSFVNNALTLFAGNGDTIGTLGFAPGALSGGTLTPNGLGGVTETLCFCAGTHIATPHGETPVQRLAIGDMVQTADGRAKPITWIGVGRVLATRGRRTAATPVIVRRGALADNVPTRDLHITKGHSLYLDGVLIPVEFLVNNRSILWDDRAQEVSIYHIELETHAVLLANGAPAESYRDDGNRWLFHNAKTGRHKPEQPPCAPLLTGGPVVDAAWRRLLDRAGPRPGLPLTDEPDLHLLVDGQRVDGSPRPNGYYAFDLARPPGDLRVISRAASPAELGLARDPRVLGVAVRQVRLWQGVRVRVLDASDVSLTDGFHAFETDNLFRWTDGDAALPATLFADLQGTCQLELLVGGAMRYPLLAEAPRRAA